MKSEEWNDIGQLQNSDLELELQMVKLDVI
jgi:hypothetical protein